MRGRAARDLVDYGDALAAAGDHERARQVWTYGADLPAEAGNTVWHATIRDRLARLG